MRSRKNEIFRRKKGKRREKEVCICSEHISLRRNREARNTVSEREWQLLTAERFSREDAIRVALASLTEFQSVRPISITSAFLSKHRLLFGKTGGYRFIFPFPRSAVRKGAFTEFLTNEILRNYRKSPLPQGV